MPVPLSVSAVQREILMASGCLKKPRAAGIHLIIATQHPSRDVVKGALDANIPARVALRMTGDIESKMLIRQKGAENLLGKGDLLFKDIGDPIRLQSPLLPPEERKEIYIF